MKKGLVTFLVLLSAPLSQAAKRPITIDTLMRPLSPRHGSGTIVWAPNGSQFAIDNSGTVSLYDVPSGNSREIVQLSKLESAAEKVPPSPVYEWTDRYVTENDIQWFTDNKHLLIAASGDLFIVDTANGSFEQLTKTPEVEHDPKLSPDNKYVSFRRGPNLYALDLITKKVTPLTTDGTDTLLNGEPDWVYPEELDVNTAYWWSPDSRYIAYMQFDVAHEPIFPQVSLLSQHGILEPERYPKPGDPNAEVRIGIVPAQGGETRWMQLGDPRGNLMARVTWLPSSREVAVERLPRVQNKLDLLIANIEDGGSRVVLHEEDPTWINVQGEPMFLGSGDRFLWTSERDGFRHLYLYGIDGKLQMQLTQGDWEITKIDGVDEQHNRIFYTSTETSPLERQFYQISLDGSGKNQLTKGAGTHTVSLSPAFNYFDDAYSSFTSPPGRILYKADGTELRALLQPDLTDSNEYDILPTEIVNVKADDGTLLYARMIKPAGFQPGQKYPAVVMVYGGPDVQSVRNTWQGASWDQVLAHKGFVVWQLDNRGSSGRGHKFESVVYHNFGEHELQDQKTGIQYLISQGFVDPQRIGLYGWSYGGYMTLYTVTNAPGLIKAAICGAPVTNWRNYDTIYTERYMGLPEDNPHGYEVSSPIMKAGNLQSKLLMVHNIEDDNVHFQNTMQMADAFEKADKQFFMFVFPQRSHGVGGPVRRDLLEETTAFFEQNLN